MTIISTITSTIRGEPKTWTEPVLDAPYLIDERESNRSARSGSTSGGRSGSAAGRASCASDPRRSPTTTSSRPDHADAVGGERVYRVFDVFAPGAYDAALAGPATRAPRAPRPQTIDALDGPMVQPALQTFSGWKARGAVDILNRLESKGYSVALSADSASLVVTSDRAHERPGVREALAIAGPLLVGHLRGEPLTCTVSAHKKPAVATTFALGGAPWCGTCAPEGVRP